MARPEKNNLDYFSHDCDMRNDVKIKALRRKFSHKGYSIYVMMLEYLGNCNYLQYEWNDLSIELLTPEFDIDSDELKEIINYCVFLKLFEIEEGVLINKKFYDRNQEVLNKRKSFNLSNSPLSVLKKNKLPHNSVNSTLTIVNSDLVHKEEYSIKEEIIKEESKEQNSIIKESKEQDSIEKQIKRKNILAQELRGIFKTVSNVIKLIDTNNLDLLERNEKYLFEVHFSKIMEYQNIKF